MSDRAGRHLAADHPSRSILWFTRDLRLDDNPALTAAVRAGEVVPVFVWDPAILDGGRMAPRRLALLRSALRSLDRALRERGGRLIVRRGEPAQVLATIAGEVGAGTVHAARDCTPFARSRFAAVQAAVPRLTLHAGTLLVEPEVVGEARVFSAFHRRWSAVAVPEPVDAPRRIVVPDGVDGEALDGADGSDGTDRRDRADGSHGADGMDAAEIADAGDGHVHPEPSSADPQADALARLRAFASGAAAGYARDRGRLDRDGSSRLSAALHLGLVSVRRVFFAVDDEAFRRELAWRDWASHILWFRPSALREGWDPAGNDVAWRQDDAAMHAWQDGRTGFPTVDAAMRQLRAEGWLNNRARMIVASFLAKDLLIDWREGERWFLRHLIDGDVANNSLGWQWTAGVGTDAAPYFRVLNPSLQGERFDPDGAWVKRWVPEVQGVDARFVHRPWDAPADQRPAAAAYPAPIVDHADARRRAIAAFAGAGSVRGSAGDAGAGGGSAARRDESSRDEQRR